MKPEREVILANQEIAKRIQELDPLNADHFMVNELPAFNNSSNTRAILEKLPTLIPTAETITTFDLYKSRAAIRDLGMIASSLQRHGVNIYDVPDLENALVSLGGHIGEVPRETVFHYGPWNPTGERTRTFTGTEVERIFIDSFREGMGGLDKSIQLLIASQSVPSDSPLFSELIAESGGQFDRMVKAMVDVRRRITPEFFTNILRSYFPVLTIGGKEYQAPGGAQMPVLLVDRVLWGKDLDNIDYQNYYLDNQTYLPIEYQIDQQISDESLVSKLIREYDGSTVYTSSSQRTQELLTKLLSFRYPHLQTARENFALRGEDAKGSGGYKPTILETLIDLTKEARNKVQALN